MNERRKEESLKKCINHNYKNAAACSVFCFILISRKFLTRVREGFPFSGKAVAGVQEAFRKAGLPIILSVCLFRLNNMFLKIKKNSAVSFETAEFLI